MWSILLVLLSTGSMAFAHELDEVVSPQQIQMARALPGTMVIRISKTDSKDVAVLHLKERLSPKQKVADSANFEKIAVKADSNQLVFVAGKDNERDVTSSTPAWRFGGYGGGFGGRGFGGYGGYRGFGGGYGLGYGAGYGYRGYVGAGYGYGYGNYNYGTYYADSYYPSYVYGGYNYPYVAYAGYADDSYYYSYCGCPTYYCGWY